MLKSDIPLKDLSRSQKSVSLPRSLLQDKNEVGGKRFLRNSGSYLHDVLNQKATIISI
jgi:hypothetical protein